MKMERFGVVCIPDIKRLGATFKDLFDKTAFQHFKKRIHDISMKIKEHQSLNSRMYKQQDMYHHAESEMNKAKFRLTIERNDFDHMKENLRRNKTVARLKLIKQLTRAVEKKTAIVLDEFNKYKTLMQDEIASKTAIKFEEQKLVYDLQCQFLQRESVRNAASFSAPTQHPVKFLSSAVIIEKMSVQKNLAGPEVSLMH